MTKCADCGREIDPLDVFPPHRCVECYAADPAVQRAHRNMTGERLAKMWGA